MTIFVLCPNLIGDAAMATPAFRSLRHGHPGARIVAAARPGVVATLEGGPWFDRVIALDHRSNNPAERAPAALRAIRAERPDRAVLFPGSFRSAWFALRSGARRRFGYARGGRSWLLTDRIATPRDEKGGYRVAPIVDYYRELARAAGGADDGPRLELFTSEADEQAADRAWDRLGFQGDRPVVAINTGGAFGPAKSWPAGHFAELARRLVDEQGVDVLVLSGPAERNAAREIASLAGRPGVASLADGPLGIGLSKACVRRSALLITTDSGPRHFAAAFGRPVLTLFGPTHVEWTLTHHRGSVHLRHPVPCGPCQRPTCREGHHRCLVDLAPDAVYRRAARLLRDAIPAAESIESV